MLWGNHIYIIHFAPSDLLIELRERRKVFGCNWAKSRVGRAEAQKRAAAFREATKDDEQTRQQHERLVVLKQMCANAFLAIAFAAILLGISYIPLLWLKLFLLIIIVMLLLASLFWGYRAHLLRQETCKEVVLSSSKNTKQGS